MQSISKSELNIHTAKVLDAVVPDQPAIITERGVPKWKIDSLQNGTTTINGMTCTPATNRNSWKNTPLHEVEESSHDALTYLREDRI